MAPRALKALALILALATSASALKIPSGLANGVYLAHVAADGTEQFELIPEADIANTTAPIPSAKFAKRAVPGYPVCANDYLRGDDFYDHVWDSFLGACTATGGQNLVQRRALVSYYGTAVAYMCNYNDNGNPCVTGEVVDSLNSVRGACPGGTWPWIQAGYQWIWDDWRKSYGFTNSANAFC